MVKIKRYRFRKITPEIKAEMRKLREEGLSYRKISEKFDVSYSIVCYHLSARAKRKAKERAIKWNKKLTKKQKREKTKKQQPHLSQYIMERYHNDKEFRERFKKSSRDYQKRRREELKKNHLSKHPVVTQK